ncbi:SAM-dependent methyltransferase [Nocardia abscessus]|uniref:SAM-dependent methyltransferase n=1 Tax=Nocardia abscessus TaxID=120957 RepID=UPI0024557033|nr:SAM-dependent methyltransferase [Nocardia abscessus]
MSHASEVHCHRADIPNSARIWNYWIGGKDHYEIDRLVGDACIEIHPDITTIATQARQFLVRAVHYLAADRGIRQFVDIGCGLPAARNTHEIAQCVAPEATVVYVDNDALVLTHARALLTSTTPEGTTDYIDADLRRPERIIEQAEMVLDFREPVAVLLMGVLGHVTGHDELLRIVRTLMEAMPSGSFLALWHGTDDSRRYRAMCDIYAQSGAAPLVARPRGRIEAAFEGLEMVEPGFVPITRWRTPETDVGEVRPVSAYGAVARKP